MKKSRKTYLYDLGIRNSILKDFPTGSAADIEDLRAQEKNRFLRELNQNTDEQRSDLLQTANIANFNPGRPLGSANGRVIIADLGMDGVIVIGLEAFGIVKIELKDYVEVTWRARLPRMPQGRAPKRLDLE